MSGTNVPQPTFGATGFLAPTAPAVLTGVQADWVAALGSALNLALETPQGQLTSSEAAIIADAQAQFVYLTTMMDPAYSQGRWQDGIGRFYFQTRFPASATTVACTLIGAVGVVIPEGALASDTFGQIYEASATGTIPSSGTLALSFNNIVEGPTPCAASSLIYINQTIPGWDSITNAAPGVQGSNVESRTAFEYRRAASVESNSVNTNSSIQGAVLSLLGVQDCYVTDNSTSSTATVGGVTLAANSVYVCVAGVPTTEVSIGPFASVTGTQAIASAIWTKKPPGCAYTSGSVTATVQDPSADYLGLGPSYSVTYTAASPLAVNVTCTITNSTAVPANANFLCALAVNDAFAGTDGGPRVARISATVYASRFYAGIAAQGTWAQIVDIFVGTGTPTSNTQTSTIAQIPELGVFTLVLV